MPEFERDIRELAKKYRHIRSDLQPVINQLEAGEKPGDAISGTGHEAYKLRLRNSDAHKGKSGGYRLIYLARDSASIVLVSIYSKSDQADISAEEIRHAIAAFDAASTVNDQEETE